MSRVRRLARWLPGSGIQWLAFAWILGISLTVGITFARQRGEDSRFRQAIVAEQQRQAHAQDQRTRAQCMKWRAEAGADVLLSTSDLGRVIVRTAAASYRLELSGCEQLLGPLPPVDPDAYRTAPPDPSR